MVELRDMPLACPSIQLSNACISGGHLAGIAGTSFSLSIEETCVVVPSIDQR